MGVPPFSNLLFKTLNQSERQKVEEADTVLRDYKETKVIEVHIGNIVDHKELEHHYVNFMNETKGTI